MGVRIKRDASNLALQLHPAQQAHSNGFLRKLKVQALLLLPIDKKKTHRLPKHHTTLHIQVRSENALSIRTSNAHRMEAMSEVSGSPANSFSASAALGPRTWSETKPTSHHEHGHQQRG